MGNMFDQLKQGLSEAIEYEQGKRTLRSKEVEIPAAPKEYQAKDIKALRRKLNCSQHLLAAVLNVSSKTVQSWEAGSRHPSSSANRLLEIIESEKKRNRFFQSIYR